VCVCMCIFIYIGFNPLGRSAKHAALLAGLAPRRMSRPELVDAVRYVYVCLSQINPCSLNLSVSLCICGVCVCVCVYLFLYIDI